MLKMKEQKEKNERINIAPAWHCEQVKVSRDVSIMI